MPPFATTAPAGVRRALLVKKEIALLDVRPESRFAQGHPLFAASFPLGQLEALATERLPRPHVPIVIYGDGAYDASDGSDADAEAAAGRLRQLGYRTPAEYAAGHLPGFGSAPGGQLVQETEAYVPVRGALLLLADDGGGRAAMTGSWLAQMGWDVVVVAPPSREAAGQSRRLTRAARRPARRPAPTVPLTVSTVLAGWLRAGEAAVVDLETSKRFLAGHIPGAAWALRRDLARPELADRLGRPERMPIANKTYQFD